VIFRAAHSRFRTLPVGTLFDDITVSLETWDCFRGVYHSLKRNLVHVLYAFSFPVALAYAYSYTSISYSGISRAPGASYGRIVSELKRPCWLFDRIWPWIALLRRHPRPNPLGEPECRGDGKRVVATALRKTKQTTHHQVFNSSVQLALRAEEWYCWVQRLNTATCCSFCDPNRLSFQAGSRIRNTWEELQCFPAVRHSGGS